ncbi:MAG: hypothetical protein ACLSA6_17530 [Holdemania massiliensis]
MQTAIQLFQSAWGIQLILLIVWIGVIAVYRQKTLPQRFKMLSQLLVAVTVTMTSSSSSRFAALMDHVQQI